MAQKWIKTESLGVYYREHPTRVYGVGKDKYYALFYKHEGKTRCEALGWASEKWTEGKASEVMGKLRDNRAYGTGPQTVAELKERIKEEREAEEKTKAAKAKQQVSLRDYWHEHYYAFGKRSKKANTFEKEESHFKHWLEPNLGDKPLVSITIEDWDRLMRLFDKANLKPRSKQYISGTLRRIMKHARDRGITVAIPTGKQIGATGGANNRRMRVITPDEQKDILDGLQTRNPFAYRITYFAFLTGCRISEAARLKWSDIDLENSPGSITFRDTKNKEERIIAISQKMREFLEQIFPRDSKSLVFTREDGKQYQEAPTTFALVVEKLGLNEGRDEYDRISFHNIRHTVATRLAPNLDLRSLMDVMGWKVVAMAARYIKSSEQAKREALECL